MPITVPISGAAAGRSASVPVSNAVPQGRSFAPAVPSQGAPSDTGSTFARLGDALFQIGTGLEDDRLTREAQRLDIDMTRDLFKLRQELELSNDPDAVDREWAPRLAALKEQYLTGVADNGVPRVDRKNRQRFDLAFTSLADRHAMELGARAIQLRQAVDVAQGAEMRNELVVQGAVVGDEVLPELIARGEAWIDGQAAKYGTDAATVQVQKAEFRASIYSQRADTLIANDPAGFLAAAEAGTFNDLGEDLTRRKLAAQAEITRRATLEETDRKRTEGERVKAAEALLKDGTAVYRTGSPFAREAEVDALLADPAIAALPEAAEYRNAQALARAMPDFAALPLADKQRRLAEARARPKDKAYEANVVTAMEDAVGDDIDAAKALLTEGTSVFGAGNAFGKTAEVDALLSNPAIAALPEAAQYRSAQAIFRDSPQFQALPLEEKRRLLAEERAKPKDKAYEANVVTAMEAAIADHEAAITNGTVYGYVASVTGKPVAPLPGPEATDQELAQGFYNRRVAAAGIEASGLAGGKPAPLFTPEEREVWAPLAAPDAAPADRARTARLLATGFGAETDRALKELGGDTAFAFVGGGLAAGALTEQTARQIFEGQRAIDNQDIVMPPVAARRGTFFAQFPTLFPDGTGEDGRDQSKARNSIIAAADARYAWLSRNAAPDANGAIDVDRWKQALHDVMGGKGAYDDGDATGGVQELRSGGQAYPVILPPGVSAFQVRTALERIEYRLSPGYATAPQGLAPEEWRALSPKGALPDIGSASPDLTTIQNVRLRAAGGTTYDVFLIDPETGRAVLLKDDKGAAWQIDLSKLLRTFGPEAGQ